MATDLTPADEMRAEADRHDLLTELDRLKASPVEPISPDAVPAELVTDVLNAWSLLLSAYHPKGVPQYVAIQHALAIGLNHQAAEVERLHGELLEAQGRLNDAQEVTG